MEKLKGSTVRLTVKLDNLKKGTITYADFDEMPKIGQLLKNVQFKDPTPMGKNGHLEEIIAIEEYRDCEWHRIESKLEMAGRALYGQTWQTQLGNALGTDSRRIRQWLADERPIPVGVWTDIKKLAEQRKQQIDELITKL
jgi:hypothetical protein